MIGRGFRSFFLFFPSLRFALFVFFPLVLVRVWWPVCVCVCVCVYADLSTSDRRRSVTSATAGMHHDGSDDVQIKVRAVDRGRFHFISFRFISFPYLFSTRRLTEKIREKTGATERINTEKRKRDPPRPRHPDRGCHIFIGAGPVRVTQEPRDERHSSSHRPQAPNNNATAATISTLTHTYTETHTQKEREREKETRKSPCP